MESSKKLYLKALDEYNKGYINRAIELCNESLSININNSPAINLKGLLLYLKGDLNGAKALWKINIDLNKDSISKRYLEDSLEDDIRNNLFKNASKLIKEGKIDNAIIELNKCAESDFNYINVNNYLSLCYINKEEYSKSKIHIYKVLKLDKKNRLAIQNNKKLYLIGKTKNFKEKKTLVPLASSICLVILIVVSIGIAKHKTLSNKTKSVDVNLTKEKKVSSNNKSNNTNNNKIKYDNIKDYISKKDYEKLYSELNEVDVNKINIDEKFLYNQAKELLENEGVEYFYKTGTNYLDKKDYKKAKDFLTKSYTFGKKTWVYPHNIYMLGLCNKEMGNIEEAIKYYKIYDTDFKHNTYSDIVLYNLAILYKNIDINNSKIYGQKLRDSYPDSMYNNSNIKNILNR